MSAWSDSAEAALLNHIFRGVAISFPATWYIALYTADPTDAGSATTNEVSTAVWTNYTRQGLARDTSAWTAAAAEGGGGHAVKNAAKVDFGSATVTGDPIAITHVGLVDTSSGAGNLWLHGALAVPRTITNGDPVEFPAESLAMALR